MPKTKAAVPLSERTLNVRPDTLDFRDKMYVPTLVEVPTRITLSSYKSRKIPILDQGSEGACTGFGLATVANYLLTCRKLYPDRAPVSARMSSMATTFAGSAIATTSFWSSSNAIGMQL